MIVDLLKSNNINIDDYMVSCRTEQFISSGFWIRGTENDFNTKYFSCYNMKRGFLLKLVEKNNYYRINILCEDRIPRIVIFTNNDFDKLLEYDILDKESIVIENTICKLNEHSDDLFNFSIQYPEIMKDFNDLIEYLENIKKEHP